MTIVLNGKPTVVANGAKLHDVVALITQQKTGIAVALNGEVLPSSEWVCATICESDVIEVVTAVQGG